MNIIEAIILIAIIAAAMFYLIRGIIRISKGDTSCLFCKSCKLNEENTEDSQDNQNDSACANCTKNCVNNPKQEDK
jgi:hypothetical protein